MVGRFLELGFEEFVFPEPGLEDWPVFEAVIRRVNPDIRRIGTVALSC
jgi:hypothetical protein